MMNFFDPLPCDVEPGLERLGCGVVEAGIMPKPRPGLERPVVAETTEEALEERIRAVALDLQATLTALVDQIAPAGVRPADLSRRLSVDQTLASRVLRVVRAPDPFDAARVTPSPAGLRLFRQAAGRCGASAGACEELDRVIAGFDALLLTIPGGRGGLEAAIAATVGEARERSERSAKQLIHKGASYVLGCQMDVLCKALIVFPSATRPSEGDMLHVVGNIGLRRMRHEVEVPLFATRMYPPDQPSEAIRFETVDGQPSTGMPGEFLLTDVSTCPVSSLRAIRHSGSIYHALAPGFPPLGQSTNVFIGMLSRGEWSRYRRPERPEEWFTTVPRLPVRLLVKDVFLHEDLFAGIPPAVVYHKYGLSGSQRLRDSEIAPLERVHLTASVQPLGRGMAPSDLKVEGAPQYAAAVRSAMHRIQQDPARFHGFRCRSVYPMPFLALTVWVPLPEAPQDGAAR